jgi:uncharacterized membrane protein YdcZ (DUF606 family)
MNVLIACSSSSSSTATVAATDTKSWTILTAEVGGNFAADDLVVAVVIIFRCGRNKFAIVLIDGQLIPGVLLLLAQRGFLHAT